MSSVPMGRPLLASRTREDGVEGSRPRQTSNRRDCDKTGRGTECGSERPEGECGSGPRELDAAASRRGFAFERLTGATLNPRTLLFAFSPFPTGAEGTNTKRRVVAAAA